MYAGAQLRHDNSFKPVKGTTTKEKKQRESKRKHIERKKGCFRAGADLDSTGLFALNCFVFVNKEKVCCVKLFK